MVKVSRGINSSPLPVRERIEGEGPFTARFFSRDLRFWLWLNASTEGLADCIKYFLDVCKHLIIPESQNPVVPRLQKRSSNFIFLRKLGVLGAIQFDNQALLDRAEVSEVGPNRMLTPEFCVLHPAAPQVSPQNSFCVGLFATQPSSVPLR